VTHFAAEVKPLSIALAYSVVNIKPKYLTKKEKAELNPTAIQQQILVGCLLGDLHIQKGKAAANACLKFAQGLIHEGYLQDLYDQFEDLCPSGPKISTQTHKKTGKDYSTIYFKTYSLPGFNHYYDLFYKDGRKIVPKIIGELLTRLALAH
jgi:hypothetical protein